MDNQNEISTGVHVKTLVFDTKVLTITDTNVL